MGPSHAQSATSDTAPPSRSVCALVAMSLSSSRSRMASLSSGIIGAGKVQQVTFGPGGSTPVQLTERQRWDYRNKDET